MTTSNHPLAGLKLQSFSDVLDKLPPPDPINIQRLAKEQKHHRDHRLSSGNQHTTNIKSSTYNSSIHPTSLHPSPPKYPSLLVSHDFKGNYRPSDFSTTSSLCPPDECFTMEQGWNACDVFNYFGHDRVCIPPPEWAAACRKFSPKKKVIGTIITEWQEGFRECNDFLLADKNETKLYQIVYRLATLCVEYDFDGYLVNIENPIRDTSKMRMFVQLLNDNVTSLLGSDRGLVLWYDSVVSPSGELRWQNTLNKHNSTFFESCGGIFTNYQWSEDHAIDALETIEGLNNNNNKNSNNENSASSSSSPKSVYFGTDCHGRGTFLGGKEDSHKAIGVAMSLGFSAALFAPGWTMENYDHVDIGMKKLLTNIINTDKQNILWKGGRTSFVQTNSTFWNDVTRQVGENTERSNCDDDTLAFWNVPFSTTFCASAGSVFVTFSKTVIEGGWCEQSAVELQPTNPNVPVEISCDRRNNDISVTLLEHITAQDALSHGCFWGNRSLEVKFFRNNKSGVEIFRIGGPNIEVNGTYLFQFAVPKSFAEEMKIKKMKLQLHVGKDDDEDDSECTNTLFQAPEATYHNHVFLSTAVKVKQPRAPVFLSLIVEEQESSPKGDIPPPDLHNQLLLATMNIGLIRCVKKRDDGIAQSILSVASAASSSAISFLNPKTSLKIVARTETVKQKQLVESEVSMKKHPDVAVDDSDCHHKGREMSLKQEEVEIQRQVLQLSLTDEGYARKIEQFDSIESIGVLNIETNAFSGYIFMAGVFLKSEIPCIPEDKRNCFSYVVKLLDGSYKFYR